MTCGGKKYPVNPRSFSFPKGKAKDGSLRPFLFSATAVPANVIFTDKISLHQCHWEKDTQASSDPYLLSSFNVFLFQ